MKAPRTSSGLLDAVVRVTRRHRRWLASLAAFVAVYAGLSAVQPETVPTADVVAASRTIPAGSTLTAADLVRLRVPADAVPAGARSDPGPLVGVTVNLPVPARSIITDTTVDAGRALARPGHVVLALPLDDEALATVVQPGATIDLLAPGRAAPVARNVRVLAFPDSASASALSHSQRALLIEVPADAAVAVASAAEAGSVTVVLH